MNFWLTKKPAKRALSTSSSAAAATRKLEAISCCAVDVRLSSAHQCQYLALCGSLTASSRLECNKQMWGEIRRLGQCADVVLSWRCHKQVTVLKCVRCLWFLVRKRGQREKETHSERGQYATKFNFAA